ncbi:MAG: hypothetical protein WDZ91_15150 [Paenibacillaceae bacterium]
MFSSKSSNSIIPIWHNVDYTQVYNFSPSLVDRFAIQSSKGIKHVVTELMRVIKPEGSTLIEARDFLIDYGLNPPVVTDDWWLDVLEFMGTNYHMEHWGTTLTPRDRAYSRGERIAWAAMQLIWQGEAEQLEICQTTPPRRVHEFIENSPGLAEMCRSRPEYLALYAPQLTIRGFEGNFEEVIESWYKRSIENYTENSEKAKGLTIDGKGALCDEELALRHPNFGKYEPSLITCNFVQGPLMSSGVLFYERFDYLIWLLSSESQWLPEPIRKYLTEGFMEWNQWTWEYYYLEDNTTKHKGDFLYSLYSAKSYSTFMLSESLIGEIKTRISNSIVFLELSDSIEELYKRFVDGGFIKAWFVANQRGRKSLYLEAARIALADPNTIVEINSMYSNIVTYYPGYSHHSVLLYDNGKVEYHRKLIGDKQLLAEREGKAIPFITASEVDKAQVVNIDEYIESNTRIALLELNKLAEIDV